MTHTKKQYNQNRNKDATSELKLNFHLIVSKI